MTHLLDDWDTWSGRVAAAERLLLMMDFDGTLAPIVHRPADARVPPKTLRILTELRHCPQVAMAVISGRGVVDVRQLVGLKAIHYFGCHGRERIRPGSDVVESNRKGRQAIRAICRRLRSELGQVAGFEIEDKGVSAAAHFRNVDPGNRSRVERGVRQAVEAFPSLRASPGKMVYDITPRDGMDKGAAAMALVRETGGLPLYFGDDTTDESAFGALDSEAVTVYVGPATGRSLARYRVTDPGEVGETLLKILNLVRRELPGGAPPHA